MRRKTRVIKIGKVKIGGENPVVVQSMTNTDTRDIENTVKQINELESAGCEVVRLAVINQDAANSIKLIKKRTSIPIVADIHFDYRLALASIKAGADGLRINPGNIGHEKKIKTVVEACKDHHVPIRIGVNAGSLDKKLVNKYKGITAEAMVESVMDNVRILEDMGFDSIKISLKASSVPLTVQTYRMIAAKVDYPLHLGITEAGTMERALIKTAMGLGILLNEGIGDTIRISMTADPIYEVWAGYEILRSLGIRKRGVELISCPTCGRCEIDLMRIAKEVEEQVRFIDKPIKIAVMGCVVNGPGEAKEADLGIAGGRGFGLIFKHGNIIKKVPENELVNELLEQISQF
ncbi:MAG: flavodoxin-dependent (E)-4-hydroxy-3-methylbut-2-enyl-diphosphate synthase [Syntrophomonadaceae bacterium]